MQEARRAELIATELFEAPGTWLSFRDVEGSVDSLSGTFVIHALNGDFTYRLTGWCPWLAHAATAELVSPEPLERTVVSTTAVAWY